MASLLSSKKASPGAAVNAGRAGGSSGAVKSSAAAPNASARVVDMTSGAGRAVERVRARRAAGGGSRVEDSDTRAVRERVEGQIKNTPRSPFLCLKPMQGQGARSRISLGHA